MFKKGDKVYSILKGWGEVMFVDTADEYYPLKVSFNEETEWYTANGENQVGDVAPELYHTEPVITFPKKRVEHTGWIAVFDFNEAHGYRVTSMIYPTEELARERIYEVEKGILQQITYYTEE